MPAQEILIKALTRLASFEGRSRFSTWLYRIAVNHVLNMKRGRARTADHDLPMLCAWPRHHTRAGATRSAERTRRRAVSSWTKPGSAARWACCSVSTASSAWSTSLGEIFEVPDTVGGGAPRDQPRELPPAVSPRPSRAAQLHERQVRPGEPRQSLPVRQEDQGLHRGGLGRPGQSAVRARARSARAGRGPGRSWKPSPRSTANAARSTASIPSTSPRTAGTPCDGCSRARRSGRPPIRYDGLQSDSDRLDRTAIGARGGAAHCEQSPRRAGVSRTAAPMRASARIRRFRGSPGFGQASMDRSRAHGLPRG